MSDYGLWNSTVELKEPETKPGAIRQSLATPEELSENDDDNEGAEIGRVCPDHTISKNKSYKDPRIKLELRLNHGDVVVMKGREIQRIWEVIPY